MLIHIQYTGIYLIYNLQLTNLDGSNACTIIALLMATNISTSNIRIQCLFTSPTKEHLCQLFSNAIINGNAIHQDLFKTSCSSQNTNLTVPEAMNAGKSSLGTITEWVNILKKL